MEAEELGAGGLNPEAERRLIDRDEAARIEGDEEKIVPTRQHAPDGSGVVGVGVALFGELPAVHERGEREHNAEAEVLPPEARGGKAW